MKFNNAKKTKKPQAFNYYIRSIYFHDIGGGRKACALIYFISSYFSSHLPFQVLFILSFPSEKKLQCVFFYDNSFSFYLAIHYCSPQLAEGKKPELLICPDKCFHSPCF